MDALLFAFGGFGFPAAGKTAPPHFAQKFLSIP
jgi:hypothetical protein